MTVLIEVDDEPAAGKEPDDVTCYHEDYQHCGNNRSDWPRILYQYKPDNQLPSVVKPGKLITPEGYVVLNNDDEPLLDFPDIPLTLASVCEGWRLEAFNRSNKWVTLKQLQSRMPGDSGVRSGTLSMRMTRFRRKAGAITWETTGETSEAFEAYIDQKLPQACKDANSIEAFRDLHPHEIAEMELLNVGQLPMRAKGRKNLSAQKHQGKRAEALTKYNKLLAKFNAEHGHEASEGDTANGDGEEEGEEGGEAEEEGGAGVEKSDEGFNTGDTRESEAEPFSYHGGSNNSVDIDGKTRSHTLYSVDRSDSGGDAYQGFVSNGAEEGRDLSRSDRSDPCSAETSDSELGSFLHEDPTTEAEARSIYRLLEPTRMHFIYLIGQPPPATDFDRGYIYQWGDIATALSQQWTEQGLQGPTPLLIGLNVYTADLALWNMPWDEERYGAPLDL